MIVAPAPWRNQRQGQLDVDHPGKAGIGDPVTSLGLKPASSGH
jgi:hypothetical protein